MFVFFQTNKFENLKENECEYKKYFICWLYEMFCFAAGLIETIWSARITARGQFCHCWESKKVYRADDGSCDDHLFVRQFTRDSLSIDSSKPPKVLPVFQFFSQAFDSNPSYVAHFFFFTKLIRIKLRTEKTRIKIDQLKSYNN